MIPGNRLIRQRRTGTAGRLVAARRLGSGTQKSGFKVELIREQVNVGLANRKVFIGMKDCNSKSSFGFLGRFSVWMATGLGVGLIVPAPGTCGAAIWGLPLAWAIGQLHGIGWQIVAIVVANLVGVPLATMAGRVLGGKKDNQAIIWDEIATVPVVFFLVPLTSWKVAVAGFIAHRLCDITKPPPARQLERLPEGLGVMADDWMASIYACLLMAAVAWGFRSAGWLILSVVVGG
jgi:phosphatidylglycerophosphatase A